MRTKIAQRRCVACDRLIPVERLRLLPETWTCVEHSEVEPVTDDPAEFPTEPRRPAVERVGGGVFRPHRRA